VLVGPVRLAGPPFHGPQYSPRCAPSRLMTPARKRFPHCCVRVPISPNVVTWNTRPEANDREAGIPPSSEPWAERPGTEGAESGKQKEDDVGIGVGLFLIAVGAVLAFAVHVTSNGFDVNTVSAILLAVGMFGVRLSMC